MPQKNYGKYFQPQIICVIRFAVNYGRMPAFRGFLPQNKYHC
jgi:hypothetical protein